MMSWTALSTIVESLGVVAVLVTLIYLALQTRQNADAMVASTRQAILTSDQEFLQSIRDDPELELLRFKPTLTDHEKIRVGFMFLTFVRMRENNWFQFEAGVLDQSTWASYRNSIVAMFASTNGRKWWKFYGSIPGYWDSRFVAMVDDLLRDSPTITQSRHLAVFD